MSDARRVITDCHKPDSTKTPLQELSTILRIVVERCAACRRVQRACVRGPGAAVIVAAILDETNGDTEGSTTVSDNQARIRYVSVPRLYTLYQSVARMGE